MSSTSTSSSSIFDDLQRRAGLLKEETDGIKATMLSNTANLGGRQVEKGCRLRPLQIALIVAGVAMIAIGLFAFFSPSAWQGGVFPGTGQRIAGLALGCGMGAAALAFVVISISPKLQNSIFGCFDRCMGRR